MRVLLFGASGMVGQGALRECLLDPAVSGVTAVVRKPSGAVHPKLREVVHSDFRDFASLESEFRGIDACLFALGVTSAGMNEAAYRSVTRDIAVAAGLQLARLNPGMKFIFISGAGADGTEKGRVMWARVKGEAENALLGIPQLDAYVFRPAAIRPLHGIRSRTAWIRVMTVLLAPLLAVLTRALPQYVSTTERLGRAMLQVAREGAPKRVLESSDIARLTAR